MADATTALRDAAKALDSVSDTPRLDAELLMAHSLGMERGEMLLRLYGLDAPDGFPALLERRLAHEPVAYIIGQRDFWDLTFDVSPAVLIPRADSETLIEAASAHFRDRQPRHILDLGTGSGALLLAALSLFPDASGLGLDASPDALGVASANAAKLGFADRAKFVETSWRNPGWSAAMGAFDLILCNPPYVETTAELATQVRDYEPHAALFAGDDGLEEYRILVPLIPSLLLPDGVAIFELGKGQDAVVGELATSAGLGSVRHSDLAGIVRALSLTQ
jgi:release factor glutamine methyltransferase